jgi:hypothetical protein
MLKIGDYVIHHTFPQWGKGVIVGTMIDTTTEKHYARVMWEMLNSDKMPIHTMEHLQRLTISDTSEKPAEQLKLF